MAKIESYTAQNTPSNVISGRRAVGSDFGSGEGLQKINDTLAEIQKSRDTIEYTKQLSQFQLDSLKREQELSTQELPDGVSYTDTVLGDFDQRIKTLNIPRSMREDFALDMQKLRLSTAQGAFRTETARSAEKAKRDWENILVNESNAVALNPSLQATSIERMAKAIDTLRLDPEAKATMMDNATESIRSSAAAAIATTRPGEFLNQAKSGQWNDVPDVGKYMRSAEAQIKSFEAQRKKAAIEARQADIYTQLENETKFMDQISSPDMSHEEKLLELNKLDLAGQIRDDFGTEARRYLNSEKEINAATNSDVMADIVTRMYDLNTIAQSNPDDYLDGIRSLKTEILAKRADGELSKEDEVKLNGQMKTLMSAKTAEATSTVSQSFGEARKMIDNQLPPQYRGQAVRELFYETEGDRIKLDKDKDGRSQLKTIYKNKAKQIIDEIKTNRREVTIKTVTDKPDIEGILKSKGYTMDDVKETAKKYGLTEQQVIERLK